MRLKTVCAERATTATATAATGLYSHAPTNASGPTRRSGTTVVRVMGRSEKASLLTLPEPGECDPEKRGLNAQSRLLQRGQRRAAWCPRTTPAPTMKITPSTGFPRTERTASARKAPRITSDVALRVVIAVLPSLGGRAGLARRLQQGAHPFSLDPERTAARGLAQVLPVLADGPQETRLERVLE